MTAAELDPRAVLAFAERRYNHAGSRVEAIAREFGCNDITYFQALNRALDMVTPDVAVEYGPTIKRLRRLRALRAAQRSAR